MKNISFVTWMLGWPIFDAEMEYLHTGVFRFHATNEVSEIAISLMLIFVWVYVGAKLYVPIKAKK